MNSKTSEQFRKLVETMVKQNKTEAIYIWTSYIDKNRMAALVIEPTMTELGYRCTWTRTYEITFDKGRKITFMTPEVYARNDYDGIYIVTEKDAER